MPFRRSVQSVEAFCQSSLSGSVPSNYGDKISFAHGKTDTIKCPDHLSGRGVISTPFRVFRGVFTISKYQIITFDNDFVRHKNLFLASGLPYFSLLTMTYFTYYYIHMGDIMLQPVTLSPFSCLSYNEGTMGRRLFELDSVSVVKVVVIPSL
jgi:hypothetical protein